MVRHGEGKGSLEPRRGVPDEGPRSAMESRVMLIIPAPHDSCAGLDIRRGSTRNSFSVSGVAYDGRWLRRRRDWLEQLAHNAVQFPMVARRRL